MAVFIQNSSDSEFDGFSDGEVERTQNILILQRKRALRLILDSDVDLSDSDEESTFEVGISHRLQLEGIGSDSDSCKLM
jgi:hypothetical protein